MCKGLAKLRRKLPKDGRLMESFKPGIEQKTNRVEGAATMPGRYFLFLGAVGLLSIGSTVSAQQPQSPAQHEPTARGKMMMDCQRMMQGQGQSPSSNMMEHCRNMMG